jgi:hypothetical protein
VDVNKHFVWRIMLFDIYCWCLGIFFIKTSQMMSGWSVYEQRNPTAFTSFSSSLSLQSFAPSSWLWPTLCESSQILVFHFVRTKELERSFTFLHSGIDLERNYKVVLGNSFREPPPLKYHDLRCIFTLWSLARSKFDLFSLVVAKSKSCKREFDGAVQFLENTKASSYSFDLLCVQLSLMRRFREKKTRKWCVS